MAEPRHLALALAGHRILHDYNLAGADLRDLNLEGANLKWANLRGANLEYAKLRDAKLKDANLADANLVGVSLYRADLRYASLYRANLRYANLEGANLKNANLERANLRNANLAGANLKGADLKGADLYRANLRGADLEDANLEGANLEGANLEDANLEGTILESPPVTRPARSFGRQTGAVLKMGKADAPSKAADFKKKYPAEFERLKGDTQGRDFSDTLRAKVRQKYETPFSWLVTEGRWGSITQRICPDPNLVFKFNIDLTDAAFTERQREAMRKLAETSRRSGHPHEKHDLFTVGWVRLCVNDAEQTWLVEEVQSDVGVVRSKLKDGSAPAGLEQYADVVRDLQPYLDRFYEDALGVVFMEAEQRGYAVEMLDYPAKKQHGSPRNVYEDLPRSMGMTKQKGSKVVPAAVEETWYYKPNPYRRKNRR